MKGETKAYILVLVLDFLILLSHGVFARKTQDFFYSAISAVDRTVGGLSSMFYSLEDDWRAVAKARDVLKGEKELREEILRLRLENMRLRQEIHRCSLERSFPLSSVFYARTVFLNPRNVNLNFSVEAGWGQGIKEGMAVVDEKGNAVGKIIPPVSYSRSWVKPITSPMSAIGVKVRGQYGVARGRGENLLVLDYLYPTSGVKEGDEVFTSGLDGIFPPGIPVGRVERVRKTSGIFLTVEVKPYFSVDTLEFVGIIRKW